MRAGAGQAPRCRRRACRGRRRELNAEIWERTRDDPWDEVVARFEASRARVRGVVASYDDAALFTKKRFAWTGSTSVGSYAVSATTSHYDWARKLVRAFSRGLRDG